MLDYWLIRDGQGGLVSCGGRQEKNLTLWVKSKNLRFSENAGYGHRKDSVFRGGASLDSIAVSLFGKMTVDTEETLINTKEYQTKDPK